MYFFSTNVLVRIIFTLSIVDTFLYLFLQQYFVCDYAVNVDCIGAEGFYSLNDNFGAVVAEERSDDVAFEDEDAARK